MNQTISIEHPELAVRPNQPAASAEGGGAAEILRMFWRRKMMLLGTMALITGFAALTAFQITPRFTSSARLMVHTENPMSAIRGLEFNPQSLVRNLRSAMFGEIEVMRSHRLSEKAVIQLGLMDDPEFNKSLRSGVLSAFAEIGPIQWIAALFGPVEEIPQTSKEKSELELRETVEKFRARLEVRPPGLSNVVNMSFESENPQKSARIANTYAKLYIADQLDRKFQANVQAGRWLDDRLSELRETMIRSEREVGAFQASHKLSITGRPALADEQLTELNRQMMRAKADYAERRVRLNQVRKLMAQQDGLESVKEVRASNIIIRLRDQESILIRRAAELETRFGERHPKMINIRAEISNVRARVKDEESRIIDELRNEARVAEARINTLKAELNKLDNDRASVNQDKVQLHQLQREAAANRKLYETFLARFKVSKQQETLNKSMIEVVSVARTPLEPTFPRKGIIIALGFVISIAVGGSLVFLLERLDNGFRTKTQVERVMGTVVLGSIPKPMGVHRRARAISDLVSQETTGPYVEAIRSLRTSLLVSNIDRPPKTLLIASSMPGEGKTSLAVSIARLAAISALEGRVILIDGDLRKPAVAPEMSLKAEKGLIHYFSGQATLEEIIVEDPQTGLFAILAAPGTPNPTELLNSSHMRELLTKLEKEYDTVVIDSPALSQVSDALVLAHHADATVFVVQWETTPRHIAHESFKLLMRASANIAGVVLQKVNVRRSSTYAYEEYSS